MFTPQERNLYRYYNGTREVAADPLAIQRKLTTFPNFDLVADIKRMQLNNQESLLAFGRLLEAARCAFDILPFSESEDGTQVGLLETETVSLVIDFGNWLGAVKKNIPTQPDSPPISESK